MPARALKAPLPLAPPPTLPLTPLLKSLPKLPPTRLPILPLSVPMTLPPTPPGPAAASRRALPGWLRPRPADAPQAQWQPQAEGQGVLRLSGRWRRGSLPRATALPPVQALTVDGAALSDWDARLPAWLWPLLDAAQRGGATVALQAMPPALQASLEVALAQSAQSATANPAARQGAGAAAGAGVGAAASPAMPAARASAAPAATARQPATGSAPASPGPLTRLGEGTLRAWQERQRTLNFIGQVVLAAVATLGRSVQPGLRSALRASDVAFQFEQVGPRSLGIVALVSALVGLILAYMSGAQLQLFGAQSFVAPLLSIGEVREIAALVVGIVLSGRVAASFAAQLATMRGSEEIDALRTLGVDPVDFLVLPRLAALLLAAPLLTVLAAGSGVLAGGVVAFGVYEVPAREYLSRGLESLTLTHVGVGLFKGLLYGALVGLAGCRQGLYAERSAQGVGEATTAAVVQAIVWVAVAAAGTTVIFHQLGW